MAVATPSRAGASVPAVASCETPFAGGELSADGSPTSGEAWSGVATSRARAGVIALWSDTQVAVSRDDGRTFRRLKAAFEHVNDVVVGASGTVFVLDGTTISIERSGGHVRRVPVPHADPDYAERARLAVGGGYLAHTSPAGLVLTRDYGATWQAKALPSYADVVELTIEEDGVLDAKLSVHNCHSGDYDLFFRGSLGGPWAEIAYSVAWLGHTLGYDPSYEEDVIRVRRVEPSGLGPVIYESSPDTEFWPATVVHNGRKDYALFSGQLYRLAQEKAELLPGDVPDDLALLAVDSCDRLLGLRNERLVRWSASTGWRQLDVGND